MQEKNSFKQLTVEELARLSGGGGISFSSWKLLPAPRPRRRSKIWLT